MICQVTLPAYSKFNTYQPEKLAVILENGSALLLTQQSVKT